jgi:hypothetical protein
LAHAIRLGIKPFTELGANSEALSGSQVNSPCSCRAILESAPVTLLQSRFFRRSGSVIWWGPYCAPGKLGKGGSDVVPKPFTGTLRVTNPVRQSRASSRKRVLRGPGATRAAKRRQPVSGSCDGAPKSPLRGSRRRNRNGRPRRGAAKAWRARSRRGQRAGHVHEGSPGTWEAPPPPRHLPAGDTG